MIVQKKKEKNSLFYVNEEYLRICSNMHEFFIWKILLCLVSIKLDKK